MLSLQKQTKSLLNDYPLNYKCKFTTVNPMILFRIVNRISYNTD